MKVSVLVCFLISVNNAIGTYSPDGQGMGNFLMDGQNHHMAMRHPAAWGAGKSNLKFRNKKAYSQQDD